MQQKTHPLQTSQCQLKLQSPALQKIIFIAVFCYQNCKQIEQIFSANCARSQRFCCFLRLFEDGGDFWAPVQMETP